MKQRGWGTFVFGAAVMTLTPAERVAVGTCMQQLLTHRHWTFAGCAGSCTSLVG